jgi:'Cold-shock' DNA-binding domain
VLLICLLVGFALENCSEKKEAGNEQLVRGLRAYRVLAAAAGTYSSHISAVERAGLSSLNDGQTIEYEIERNRGKESAVDLKVK